MSPVTPRLPRPATNSPGRNSNSSSSSGSSGGSAASPSLGGGLGSGIDRDLGSGIDRGLGSGVAGHLGDNLPSTLYATLVAQLEALLNGELDWLANLANAAALIYHSLPRLNWAGFYLYKAGELVLGPFQGRPACVRIAVGRGVCGAAWQQRHTLVVPDVTQFPGHIACDPASRSEVVVPLIADGTGPCRVPVPYGVLDLDSAELNRFTEADARGLEAVVAALMPLVRWEQAVRG